jgi:hypothetical protein
MINLWNLNSICHLHCMGLCINFVLLFLLWFGIHLHLVTANKIWTNLLKAMLSFNPYCWSAFTSHELTPLVSSCHIIPHNLLSDEHVWSHPYCHTPPQEKYRWFKRSHTTRSSIQTRWRLPVDFMTPMMDFRSFYIYLLFCKTSAM